MERPRPEPAAIDITWLSCRGVKSSLPFHTPCLYASIFVAPSSAKNVHGHRRPHRVKTPTDRAGGENPEWDTPLRLYLPEATPLPPAGLEAAAGEKTKNQKDSGGSDDVLLVRFEIKAEVAVLGDVLAASAAVPVPDLVADGRTRRVSYQLVGPDGRQRNGVISFSYTFHERNDHAHHGSDDGELLVVAPPCPTASSPDAHSSPTAAAPRLYPAVEWLLTEQMPIYPPVPGGGADGVTLGKSRYYPPPPPSSVTAPEPAVAVYPPLPEKSSCSVYPTVGEVAPASGMYPTVDLAPVSCYPPPLYGVECGYATAAPGWDDRCLHG